MNPFEQLYQTELAHSTRPFNARGKSVVRCSTCKLAARACICAYTPAGECQSEFILLIHRDELFKPTNSGKLVAQLYPQNTQVFCWQRTTPDAHLLEILADPNRRCMLLYPEAPVNDNQTANAQSLREVHTDIPQDNKISTFILLDGTWKQSTRMLRLSRWLDNIACLSLSQDSVEQAITSAYSVRKALHADQLSTAQAASVCLWLAREHEQAKLLDAYFAIFNQHYIATRMNTQVTESDAHKLCLEHRKKA